MKRKPRLPPQLKSLQVVQLTLDLPQFRIKPGSRILDVGSGKTGRVSCWYIDHIISFPGERIKSIPRHLLVEIQ
jgi:cyclopropane fatty-acyl-phospholipid synthase-like methyltransferase